MEQQKEFDAAVAKVATLCDSGIRVHLDLAEHEIGTAAWLMECQREGYALRITAVRE